MLSDTPGMHVNGFWTSFMADAGNKPGAQQGDVTIHLAAPVEGLHEVTCPSAGITVAAEMGQFIGLQVVLADGRHLFVPAANVAGIIDTPAEKLQTRPRSAGGKP